MEEWKKAGKIAKQALEYGEKLIKPGAKKLDVAEAIEKFIFDKGAGTAFPVNLSCNNEAAHYTPGIADDAVFGEKDVVKLDVGTEVDGYLGDTAKTIDLSGENAKLVEASHEALDNLISAAKAGIMSNELGRIVEETIKKRGFEPVRNLTGHRMEEHTLHTGYTIPNVGGSGGFALEENMVLAVEPFASKGQGKVSEQRRVEIFSVEQPKPLRNADARKILDFAAEKWQALPFAERWLTQACSGFQLKAALRELLQKEAFTGYPILSDTGLVSQAEHTIIITKDGCEVIT